MASRKKRSGKKRIAIRPNTDALRTERIRPGVAPNPLVNFSFRMYHEDDPDFQCEGLDSTYFTALLQRLRDFSRMTFNELANAKGKGARCHPINWKGTTKPEGYSHLPEQLQGSMPWQLSISANEYGRVHGFFLDNTFMVVWIDPNHNLYS